MALIQCRYCGETVSDKAVKCPHCGETLIDDSKSGNAKSYCGECGTEIPKGAAFCPNCGCPVPEKSENRSDFSNNDEKISGKVSTEHSGNKRLLILVVAAIAIIAAIVVNTVNENRRYRSIQYISNVEKTAISLLEGAAEAETTCNLIKSVWYNNIYEEEDPDTDRYTREDDGNGSFYSDFNDALSNLYNDPDFESRISSIENAQESNTGLMKKLTNPPEKHREAYEALLDLYDAYIAFINIAKNPTGSLITFTEDFTSADSTFITCYNRINIYFE